MGTQPRPHIAMLYFVGDGDLTMCFYCGIGLKDWSDADDPLVAHVRYAPDCQFLVDTIPPTLLTRIKVCYDYSSIPYL